MNDDLRMLRTLLTAPPPSPEVTQARRRQLQDAIADCVPALAGTRRGRAAAGHDPRTRAAFRPRASLIAAVTAAAAALITLATWLPSGGASPADAWTVTRKPDGAIAVTIRQLNNPNALLRELRVDGVRASFDGLPAITRHNTINWACLRGMTPALRRALTVRKSRDPHAAALLLHPSAIPPGATLSIYWADYSPHGFAHTKVSAGGGVRVPSSSRPGARMIWRRYTIPLTVSGDFTFDAAFVTPAGRCLP